MRPTSGFCQLLLFLIPATSVSFVTASNQHGPFGTISLVSKGGAQAVRTERSSQRSKEEEDAVPDSKLYSSNNSIDRSDFSVFESDGDYVRFWTNMLWWT